MGNKIKTQSKGFEATKKLLERSQEVSIYEILDKYGKIGVERLKNVTPVKTGKTSESWIYRIVKIDDNNYSLQFRNTNMVGYVSIVTILDKGHLTRSGSFVEGLNFIDPTLEVVFKECEENLRKELCGE